jgi:hypothetical protein
MSKKPHGRPTDCTPEITQKIAEAYRRGLFETTIAGLFGKSVTTLKSWRERGEKGEEPFLTYLLTTKKAEAEWESESVNEINQATQDKYDEVGKLLRKGEWQARAWLLERRYQSRYGRYNTKIKIDHIVNDSMSDMEKLKSLADSIISQTAEGELSIESANLMLSAIENRRKLIETMEHEQRLKEIGEQLKKLGA